MYLTKIELQLHHRAVQAALADCQKMHRLIMGLFETQRQDAKVLYRLRVERGSSAVYLYSELPVNQERLIPGMCFAGERELTAWLHQMQEGVFLRFDLLTSPCKKVMEEGSRNSRRRILRTQEERFRWLERKSLDGGFRLTQVQELENTSLRGCHGRDKGGAFSAGVYHYTGMLEITDAERFRRTLSEGIGAYRSYGLGMLLLSGV